jgi:small subunit ribosomal protein S35
LKLPPRSKKKMMLLAGDKYNPKTDEITLLGQECPTRQQNTEYVIYLMKVLYMESLKEEPWEKELYD